MDNIKTEIKNSMPNPDKMDGRGKESFFERFAEKRRKRLDEKFEKEKMKLEQEIKKEQLKLQKTGIQRKHEREIEHEKTAIKTLREKRAALKGNGLKKFEKGAVRFIKKLGE